jgi:SNF2 family DNA or RNA helicase
MPDSLTSNTLPNSHFKTKPYAHQLAAYERFKDAPYFFLAMEQRCGKSKPTLDIAAHKYRNGEIDSLLIIAPNGVHRNWITDEIPLHLPDDTDYRCLLWQSGKMDTVKAKSNNEAFLAHNGLRILAVNVDAIPTKAFRAFATKFYHRHKVMAGVDESVDIGNHAAVRSKQALKFAQRSAVRFILDGTPIAAGPLGLFNQCEFLSPGVLGFPDFYSFRHRYAVMDTLDVGQRNNLCPVCSDDNRFPSCERCKGVGYVGRSVKVVKSYQNVEELQEKLYRFTVRILRSDCYDLPPKIRQKAYFDLTGEQRRIYDEMRKKFVVELKDVGHVTASMVLTRYIRLQQISSGFLSTPPIVHPCPNCGGLFAECPRCDGLGVSLEEVKPKPIPLDGNARLDAFANAVASAGGQKIVWCRWTYDVDIVMRWCSDHGLTAVRYDGQTDDEQRAANLIKFREDCAEYFVGTPGAGGRGLDLSCADTVIYYSHDWSLRKRLQSEDRAQNLRKTTPTSYIDLIATDTVDVKIVNALREGKRLSDLITGDRPEGWL